MPAKQEMRPLQIFAAAFLSIFLAACVAILVLLPAHSSAAQTTPQKTADHAASDPWTSGQTVQPADLAAELKKNAKTGKPAAVCVGFHTLYEGAHIPGANFHGAASTAAGLDDLKRWAQDQPRSANIVIYCGCCPLTHCPNIRPAFAALRSMGFTHLRVLLLPRDFAGDWVARGYAVEKGK